MADIETSNITATGNWDLTGGDLKTAAPTVDTDAATKKYVDDNAGGAPEGTAVLSTGETGGTKFLREDGDNTCSWQTISGGGDALVANPLSQFATTTSLQLLGVMSDETGTGALCFATSPTLVTPVLGTPASGNISNCTAYPSGNIDHDTTLNFVANEHIDWTGASAGTIHATNYVDNDTTYSAGDGLDLTTTTFSLDLKLNGGLVIDTTEVTVDLGASAITGTLAVADGGTGVTTSTGTGNTVLSTSPTFTTPILGTPTSGTLTNATGLPAASIVAGSLVAGMLASDHGTAATDELVNVCYGTSATPPTASTTTEGALYVQYTA